MATEIHKPLLLLVEDDEDDAFFFQRTFEKSGDGLSVHHVQTGSAAVEFLRTSSHAHRLPRVIFLDLKMPVMNGFEVLEWMQKQPQLKSIPVVVLSGSEQQKDKEQARQLGAAEYLVKPLLVEDLKRVLQKTSVLSPDPSALRTGVQA